jgi:hypothetical protein
MIAVMLAEHINETLQHSPQLKFEFAKQDNGGHTLFSGNPNDPICQK